MAELQKRRPASAASQPSLAPPRTSPGPVNGRWSQLATRLAPGVLQRAPDPFGADYGATAQADLDKDKQAIGKDAVHAPLQAASAYRSRKGKQGLVVVSFNSLTLEDLKHIFIPPGTPAADAAEIEKVLPARVDQIHRAFRIAQLDTVEAQATYLAHAFSESRQLRTFGAQKDPSLVGQFKGRGPLQVTLRSNYIKTLAYLDAIAERLEQEPDEPYAKSDAKLAREASAAIKADPAAAEKPEYASLFSAAFMHAAGKGGVKAVAELSGGVDPTFSGNAIEDSWMTGGIAIAARLAAAKATQSGIKKGAPGRAEADKEVNNLAGLQAAANRKNAAYDRAAERLKAKLKPVLPSIPENPPPDQSWEEPASSGERFEEPLRGVYLRLPGPF